MRKYSLLAVMVVLSLGCAVARAALVWTGGGDGVSLYQEANWQDTGTGLPPPAGAVNPNTAVNDDLIVNSGTVGGASGASAHLVLGASGSVTLNNGTFRMSKGASAGIRNGAITVNTGQLLSQFFANGAALTLAGGTTTLYGGGNPVNASTVDLTGAGAVLRFENETPNAFGSEHLSKVTVNGQPGSIGDNLRVIPFNGNSGSQVTIFQPQTLTWTGGGDQISFADEANWTGLASTKGVINLNKLVDDYVINDPNANLPGVTDPDFKGGSLTILAGQMAVGGGSGIDGILGAEELTVLGGQLRSQWLKGLDVTLGGDGEIILNSGAAPLPGGTTVDIAGWESVFYFNNETPAAFRNEHLGKFTVFGAPAVEGSNLRILPYNGSNGSMVFAVPEPATLSLAALGLASLAGYVRRRKRRA